jgi:hypothetical protein
MNKLTFLLGSLATASAVLGANAVIAADLPAGTVIDASNINKVKNDTFSGHVIGSLLTEKVEWQIRNWGLKITLDAAKPYPEDPAMAAATRKYAGKAQFDPATREVTGYLAGVPFPEVSEADPFAGDKIMWNFYYNPREGNIAYNRFATAAISGDKGLEGSTDWIYQRISYKARTSGEPTIGDGSTLSKTFVLAQAPADIKGLGTFAVRYDSPKMEDSWAYLKSARRTRRLSGGAWMDPVGGTDFLNDDLDVFNSRPSWYPKFKLLGKRFVLVISDSRKDIYNAAKKGTAEEFPAIDLKNKPYWNPVEKWQPREVYVVEATAPAEHPYSKRVMYIDTKVFRPYFSENYDKKGEFWKFVNAHVRPVIAEDGAHALYVTYLDFIDFKSRHASSTPVYDFKVNPKNVKEEHWSLGTLERLAQ